MERFFDTANLQSLLAAPHCWRLVSGAFPPEEPEVRNIRYDRWVGGHHDRHNHREILFCIEGRSCEHFNGRNYRCHPGTLFLFDKGDLHAQGYPLDGRSFVHLWLSLLADDLIVHTFTQRAAVTADMRAPPLVLTRHDRDQLDLCWQQTLAPPPWLTPQISRAALLSALHTIIMRICGDWLTPTARNTLRRHEAMIAAMKRHIETHLADGCDLDALARLAGYSKFHFCRVFRSCADETISQFIDRCRLKRAGAMTAACARQKEIAAALGFASPVAFANWRRKMISSAAGPSFREYPSG